MGKFDQSLLWADLTELDADISASFSFNYSTVGEAYITQGYKMRKKTVCQARTFSERTSQNSISIPPKQALTRPSSPSCL